MTRRSIGSAFRLLSLLLVFVVAIGVFAVIRNLGWLSVIGIGNTSNDSQVITAIERTQEVSLLSLGVQGLKEESRSRTVLGKTVPGSGEKVFLQYNFRAKLGIDGAQVRIIKTGENAYRISIPQFSFIGYDEPTFKVAFEDGGALGFMTPDIDNVELVNEILNDDARGEYITSNSELLEEQAQTFYNSLITSIDPAARTEFEFTPDVR